MEVMIEERLAALFDSVKGGGQVPQAVLRRLQFLARVMQEAPAARAGTVRLLWYDPAGKVQAHEVGATEVIIGREGACEVVLASLKVSRRHCAVRRVQAGAAILEVEDLGSSNGTAVNGVRLPERGRRFIGDGDVIEVAGVAVGVFGA
jgi:hypothetical protein